MSDSWPSCCSGSRQSLSHPLHPPGSALPAQHSSEGSQRQWESHVSGIANRNLHHIISSGYSQETAHKNLGVFMGLGWWVRTAEEKTPRVSKNRPAPGLGAEVVLQGDGGRMGRAVGEGDDGHTFLSGTHAATSFGVSHPQLDTMISFYRWEIEGPKGETPASGDP